MGEKKVLGKGLSAIFNDLYEDSEKIENINVNDVHLSPYQPRNIVDDESLNELSASIKEKGVIQPIIARKKGNSYELIAGERRLKASKLAGLETIPVIIKNLSDEEAAQISLIENIQREDLNPLDEAIAYKSLIDNFSYTQEDLAEKLGKNRATIANTMRLLKLPQQVIELIKTNKISQSHARALLALDDQALQAQIANLIVSRRLNVRQTEHLVKKKQAFVDFKQYEIRFAEIFEKPVKVKFSGTKGKLEITFNSKEELENFLDKFVKN